MANKHKSSAKRPHQSQGSEKNNEHGVAHSPPQLDIAPRPKPEDLGAWHQYMLELEKRVKAAFGEDGLRKLSGLDTNIDPVALAQVAARFVPQTYFRRGYQQALVKAALLLKEANAIVKDGPTIFSIPEELLEDFKREKWSVDQTAETIKSGKSDYQKIVEMDRIDDPRKRFTERAKLITGQNRSDRAETDLFEYLGDGARREGRTDFDTYKIEWKEQLRNVRECHLLILNMKASFSAWKKAVKVAKASAAGKKSRKNAKAQKS